MALYEFNTTIYLGWSHSGEVSSTGKGTVNLSDEEVAILVSQMKEYGSQDYRELKLSSKYPNLYNKLRRTYRKVAYETEELYWLIDGLDVGEYEYDEIELMKYCAENCGFDQFECDEYDDDFDGDEEETYESAFEAFCPWLKEYVKTLKYEEAIHFFHDIMKVEMEFDDSYFSNSYSTILPKEITDLA